MSHADAAESLPSPASNPSSSDVKRKYSQPYEQSHSPSPSPTADCPGGDSLGQKQSVPRALNPAPLATRIVPGSITATASPPGLDSAYPSPVGGGPGSGGLGGGGPTSTSYVVPPRPKPGRKPATDEPASKRKAQNRESQRAFRARKAAKLNEMKTQVEVAEMQHRHEMHLKMQELADREQRIRQLETLVDHLGEGEKRALTERDEWRDKALQLEELVKYMKERSGSDTPWQDKFPSLSNFTSLGDTTNAYDLPKTTEIACSICKTTGTCICLDGVTTGSNDTVFLTSVPLTLGSDRNISSGVKDTHAHKEEPATLFAEREIDFTAQFASKRSRVETQVERRPDTTSIAFLTQPSHAEAGCGFCTAESYCVCRDTTLQDIQTRSDDRSWNTTDEAPQQLTPSTANTASGPGSCADCQRDPKQRAWCQRVAQLKTSSTPRDDYVSRASSPSPLTPSTPNDPSPMEPRAHYASIPAETTARDSSSLASPPETDTNMPDAPSIGCSDAYKLLDGRVPTESMDWSTLRPIRPDTHREQQLPGIESATGGASNGAGCGGASANGRTYSALELDTAGVIATLQHARGPLTPRKEDGKYEGLVRIARDWRRGTSGSPRP